MRKEKAAGAAMMRFIMKLANVLAFALAFELPRPAAAPPLAEVKLADAHEKIQSADLLLYRREKFSWRKPGTWAGLLIAIVGRSDYTHAATVAWLGSQLMVFEVRELKGGRIVTLESQVQKYPGRIDLYTANWNSACPTYSRAGVVEYMARLAGCRYGWRSILKASLVHLPGVRCWVSPNLDDESCTADPPFCSHARAMADRIGGGFDPVPNLADAITEPGDLARSPFYRRRFTLVPGSESSEFRV